MIILGCDPSLTDFGWSVMELNQDGERKQIDSGRFRTYSYQFFVLRYRKHREGIRDVIEEHQPDFIGVEKPHHNASWSAGLYPIWISISEVCYDNRIPFATYVPSQVKAYARDVLDDSGKMFKQDMVDTANVLLSEDDDVNRNLNHNIADAIVIGYMSWRFKLLLDGEITEEDLTDKEEYLFTRTIKKRKTGNIEKKGLIYKEGDVYWNLKDEEYDDLYDDE